MSDNLNRGAAGAMPATGAMPGDTANTSTPGANGATPAAGATPPPDAQQFDSWLAGQDEPTRTLIGARFSTLESTLSTERETRKELSKQLKDLSGKLDANSEAAKQLATIQSSMEAERKRADFYEQATAAGCVKLKPAYLVAQADNLTIDQVKTQYPELFAINRSPVTHAGNGTGGPPAPAATMNDLIRRAARGG